VVYQESTVLHDTALMHTITHILNVD